MSTIIELPQTTLYYREGASDKVYQCQVEPAGDRYVVTFAYGRRGTTLNTGTKTNVPVDLDAAVRVYDKLVREKQAKGYTMGETGTPYQNIETKPSGIQPQLLNAIDEAKVLDLVNDDNWLMQEKHDGRRLLIRKCGQDIIGINKKGNTAGLSLPLFDVVRSIEMDVIIDGESICEQLVAFDLLELDGVDIRSWPYRERLAALMNLLFSLQQSAIKLIQTAFTTEQKLALMNGLRTTQREGLVLKQAYAPYSPGRPNSGGNQLKYKFVASLSALVTRQNPQRSVAISLLGKNGWQSAGNVTIPPNERIPLVGQVIEVRYLYAFPESDTLYQPVYLGKRFDVDMGECTISQLKYK